MGAFILQEEYPLGAVFSKPLLFHPAGLAVDEFDGAADSVFVSEGKTGLRISLGISRSLIWGVPQEEIWIHNTLAQAGKTMKLLFTSAEAVATLIGGKSGLGLEVIRVADAGGATINPSTETKQDDLIADTTAILAKLIAAPSTEAKQDDLIADTTAILAKLIAAPSTEAKQTTISGQLANQASVAWGIATVGIAAAALPNQAVPDGMGVFLKAKIGNANTIYIGGDNSVAAANGYSLVAAEEFPRALRVTNVNKIWAIAGGADQFLHWLVVAP